MDEFPSLGLSVEETTWCEGCQRRQQVIDQHEKEKTTNYKTLKQKIVSTDLLIKKYRSKCEEYDQQSKMLEDVTRKLERAKRDTETLDNQLKNSLQQIEPIKNDNNILKMSLIKKESEIDVLKNKILAHEKMSIQYQAFGQENDKLQARVEKLEKDKKTFDKKLESLESSKLKAEKEVSASKESIKTLKQENRSLEKKLEKAQQIQERHLQRLQENDLMTKYDKRLRNSLIKQQQCSEEEEDEFIPVDNVPFNLGLTVPKPEVKEPKICKNIDFERMLTMSPLSFPISPLPPTPQPASTQDSDNEDLQESDFTQFDSHLSSDSEDESEIVETKEISKPKNIASESPQNVQLDKVMNNDKTLNMDSVEVSKSEIVAPETDVASEIPDVVYSNQSKKSKKTPEGPFNKQEQNVNSNATENVFGNGEIENVPTSNKECFASKTCVDQCQTLKSVIQIDKNSNLTQNLSALNELEVNPVPKTLNENTSFDVVASSLLTNESVSVECKTERNKENSKHASAIDQNSNNQNNFTESTKEVSGNSGSSEKSTKFPRNFQIAAFSPLRQPKVSTDNLRDSDNKSATELCSNLNFVKNSENETERFNSTDMSKKFNSKPCDLLETETEHGQNNVTIETKNVHVKESADTFTLNESTFSIQNKTDLEIITENSGQNPKENLQSSLHVTAGKLCPNLESKTDTSKNTKVVNDIMKICDIDRVKQEHSTTFTPSGCSEIENLTTVPKKQINTEPVSEPLPEIVDESLDSFIDDKALIEFIPPVGESEIIILDSPVKNLTSPFSFDTSDKDTDSDVVVIDSPIDKLPFSVEKENKNNNTTVLKHTPVKKLSNLLILESKTENFTEPLIKTTQNRISEDKRESSFVVIDPSFKTITTRNSTNPETKGPPRSSVHKESNKNELSNVERQDEVMHDSEIDTDSPSSCQKVTNPPVEENPSEVQNDSLDAVVVKSSAEELTGDTSKKPKLVPLSDNVMEQSEITAACDKANNTDVQYLNNLKNDTKAEQFLVMKSPKKEINDLTSVVTKSENVSDDVLVLKEKTCDLPSLSEHDERLMSQSPVSERGSSQMSTLIISESSVSMLISDDKLEIKDVKKEIKDGDFTDLKRIENEIGLNNGDKIPFVKQEGFKQEIKTSKMDEILPETNNHNAQKEPSVRGKFETPCIDEKLSRINNPRTILSKDMMKTNVMVDNSTMEISISDENQTRSETTGSELDVSVNRVGQQVAKRKKKKAKKRKKKEEIKVQNQEFTKMKNTDSVNQTVPTFTDPKESSQSTFKPIIMSQKSTGFIVTGTPDINQPCCSKTTMSPDILDTILKFDNILSKVGLEKQFLNNGSKSADTFDGISSSPPSPFDIFDMFPPISPLPPSPEAVIYLEDETCLSSLETEVDEADPVEPKAKRSKINVASAPLEMKSEKCTLEVDQAYIKGEVTGKIPEKNGKKNKRSKSVLKDEVTGPELTDQTASEFKMSSLKTKLSMEIKIEKPHKRKLTSDIIAPNEKINESATTQLLGKKPRISHCQHSAENQAPLQHLSSLHTSVLINGKDKIPGVSNQNIETGPRRSKRSLSKEIKVEDCEKDAPQQFVHSVTLVKKPEPQTEISSNGKVEMEESLSLPADITEQTSVKVEKISAESSGLKTVPNEGDMEKDLESLLKNGSSEVDKFLKTYFLSHPLPQWFQLVHIILKILKQTATNLFPEEKTTPHTHPVLFQSETNLLVLLQNIFSQYLTFSDAVLLNLLLNCVIAENGTGQSKAAMCRIFIGLCRLKGDLEQARVMTYEIVNHLCITNCVDAALLVLAVAGVWPLIFDASFPPHNITPCIMEHIVMTMSSEYRFSQSKVYHRISELCRWRLVIPADNSKILVEKVIQYLKIATGTYTETKIENFKGSAFECVAALKLLLRKEDFSFYFVYFGNRFLSQACQKWISKAEKGDFTPQYLESILTVVRDVDLVEKQPEMTRVNSIVKNYLMPVLNKPSACKNVSYAAAEAMMKLSVFSPQLTFSYLKTWFRKYKAEIPEEIKLKIQQTRKFLLENFTNFNCPEFV